MHAKFFARRLPARSSAVYDAYVIERRMYITGCGDSRYPGEVLMALDSRVVGSFFRRTSSFLWRRRRRRGGGEISVQWLVTHAAAGRVAGRRVNGVSNADELTALGRDSISIDSALAGATCMRVSYGSTRRTDATPFTYQQQQQRQQER